MRCPEAVKTIASAASERGSFSSGQEGCVLDIASEAYEKIVFREMLVSEAYDKICQAFGHGRVRCEAFFKCSMFFFDTLSFPGSLGLRNLIRQ